MTTEWFIVLSSLLFATGAVVGAAAGWVLAQRRLGGGRIHHAMRTIGLAQRALDMMCERAMSRTAHGSVLAEKQTVQNWIAESYAEWTQARLLTLYAAWKMDQVGAAGPVPAHGEPDRVAGEAMEEIERQALGDLGIADPYLVREDDT